MVKKKASINWKAEAENIHGRGKIPIKQRWTYYKVLTYMAAIDTGAAKVLHSSMNTISKGTNLDTKTTHTTLKRLEKQGYVTLKNTIGKDARGRKNRVTRSSINYDKLIQDLLETMGNAYETTLNKSIKTPSLVGGLYVLLANHANVKQAEGLTKIAIIENIVRQRREYVIKASAKVRVLEKSEYLIHYLKSCLTTSYGISEMITKQYKKSGTKIENLQGLYDTIIQNAEDLDPKTNVSWGIVTKLDPTQKLTTEQDKLIQGLMSALTMIKHVKAETYGLVNSSGLAKFSVNRLLGQ